MALREQFFVSLIYDNSKLWEKWPKHAYLKYLATMNELIFASWLNCHDVIRYLLYAQRLLDSSTFLKNIHAMKTFWLQYFQNGAGLTNITKLHKMSCTVYFQAHFTFSAESPFSACPSCSSFYPKPRIRAWRKSRNCSCPRNTKPSGMRNRRRSTSTTTADTSIVPKCNEPE